ncbi:hypothetical protein BC629DRAFT_1439390 [Irpex lacteus]|nr:hypothetical protein BC629DRAFT_1439390 [Irpex lacteus]
MENPFGPQQMAIIEYANLKNMLCKTTCSRYEPPPNMAKYMVECKKILERPTANVRASALAGNMDDCLEMGLRTYAGVEGTAGTANDAIFWWTKAAGAHSTNALSSVKADIPRGVEARAWSCLTHAYKELAKENDGTTCNVDRMYRAASCAERACSLGFMSPIICGLANEIKRLNKEFPSPRDPKLSFDAPRFRELTYLWEAHQRIEEDNKAWEAKAAKRPEYSCAEPGCGTRATRKSGLKKCAGKCPLESKPSYCSKECQRKDWKRHKPVCLGIPWVPRPEKSASEESIKYTGTETKEFEFRDRGQVLSMDLPIAGHMIKFSSSTMTPEHMKSVRDAAMKHELGR